MARHDVLAWAAVGLPLAVAGGLAVLGIGPTETVALEGEMFAEGATVEQRNPMFYGLVFLSMIASGGLVYADTESFDRLRESVGAWRHLMAFSTALLYLPVAWYMWERRKVTSAEDGAQASH